jgi:neutral ceramidase
MPLRAGHSVVDISPRHSCRLMGYPFKGRCFSGDPADVHLPLAARALALRPDDAPPLVLVALDLAALPTAYAAAARSRLAGDLSLPIERVVLACTHTHSGPYVEPPPADPVEGLSEAFLQAERGYGEFLLDRILQGARQACGLTYPVSLEHREFRLELGYGRRAPQPDGKAKICWNPQEWPDRPPQPHPDPVCSLLLLRQTNGSRRYLLWSLGAHATALGKTRARLSADWPGAACRLLEEAAPECHPIFVQGAAGEIHPWVATQEDPRHVVTVGRAAAGAVALAAEATEPWASSSAATAGVAAVERRLHVGRVETAVTVWRLGPAHLVAVPVELFASLAARVRARVTGPLLFATVANGWESYLPDETAFQQGGYEADAARSHGWRTGEGERLADEIVRLIQSPP